MNGLLWPIKKLSATATPPRTEVWLVILSEFQALAFS